MDLGRFAGRRLRHEITKSMAVHEDSHAIGGHLQVIGLLRSRAGKPKLVSSPLPTSDLRRVVCLSLALLLWMPMSAPFAQQTKPVAQSAQKSTNQAPAKITTEKPTIPNDERLLMLINSTLIALNQANVTGNYSVFRELGAPGFQVANTTGQLANTFAELRNRNFDLSPILLLQPKLVQKPEITGLGMLRVTGFFPTAPEQLNFDLMYQWVKGQWRLFGIAADTGPAAPATAASNPSR